MKHLTIATAIIVAAGGFGFVSAAQAECNPRNPTACTKDAAPAAPAAPATKTPASEGPLQLHPAKLGAARHVVFHSSHHRRHSSHRVAARPHHEIKAKAQPAAPQPSGPMQPKPVPTVAVSAPPIAVMPGQQAIGFAASHEPFADVTAFATPDAPAPASAKTWAASLPGNVKIVPSDELNDLDRAADQPVAAQATAAKVQALATSTDASSKATPAQPKAEAKNESWTGWIYRVCADGVSAAASAIRAVLM